MTVLMSGAVCALWMMVVVEEELLIVNDVQIECCIFMEFADILSRKVVSCLVCTA